MKIKEKKFNTYEEIRRFKEENKNVREVGLKILENDGYLLRYIEVM